MNYFNDPDFRIGIGAIIAGLTLLFLGLSACSSAPRLPDDAQGAVTITMMRGSGTIDVPADLTIPASVDRVRLRAWNDAGQNVMTDVEMPDEGETQSVTIALPSDTYRVGIVTYSSAYNEAYAFDDTSGVVVGSGVATTVPMNLDDLIAQPQYLLEYKEMQLRLDEPIDVQTASAFFNTEQYQGNLPQGTAHYGPSAFGLPTEAPYVDSLSAAFNAYYIGQLDSLSSPVFADSAHVRVRLPLKNTWGEELAVVSPSLAAGNAPYKMRLEGQLIIEF